MSEERVYRALRVLGLAFFVFFTAFPLYTIVITSLKPLRDVQAVWRWVPSHVPLRPYLEMWEIASSDRVAFGRISPPAVSNP